MPCLIFDIETIIDAERLLRTEKSTARMIEANGKPRQETPDEVVAREAERICKLDPAVASGTKECFMAPRFHGPTHIALLLVDDQMQYLNHSLIALRKDHAPDFRGNTQTFWNTVAWVKQTHGGCRMVTWGGFRFDLPVLETCAFEYGIPMPGYLVFDQPAYNDPRSQFGTKHHLDLLPFMARGNGGLSQWSRLVGLPGKMDTNGSMVADMLKRSNGHEEVGDYNMCDTVSTYAMLYHTLFLAGELTSSFRGPTFEHAMDQCFKGRGKECQRFRALYDLNGQPI